jgi:hypothetical protein
MGFGGCSPTRTVGFARLLDENTRSGLQYEVTRRMSVRIVDGLEPIQVGKDDAERPAADAGVAELLVRRRVEIAAIEDVGEWIAPALVFERRRIGCEIA